MEGKGREATQCMDLIHMSLGRVETQADVAFHQLSVWDGVFV